MARGPDSDPSDKPRPEPARSEYALGRHEVPIDVFGSGRMSKREREGTGPRGRASTDSDAQNTPNPSTGPTVGQLQRLDDAELSSIEIGGRYRLEQRLGQGGMAEVFRGHHIDLDRPVAIKILANKQIDQDEAMSRFMREARVCARIRHPNVVEVFDFGTTPEGLVYLVMELLRGEDLRATIGRNRGLPWPRVRSLMLQICAGLEAAHAQGVIHRDLKPSNCYRVPVNGGEQIKLLDFGIAAMSHGASQARDARHLGERGARVPERRRRTPSTLPASEDQPNRLTATGTVVGTPEYMSPEQSASREVDERSDVYAAGIILAELLTGRVPYAGKSASAILAAQIYEPAPTLEQLNRAPVDPRIEALFAIAVDKRPRARFQTIREMAEAIEAIPAGGSVEVSGIFELPPVLEQQRETDANVVAGPLDTGQTAAAEPGLWSRIGRWFSRSSD